MRSARGLVQRILRTPVPCLGLAWLTLALPTLWSYLFGTWSTYSQGHELLLLAVVVWLLWRQGPALARLPWVGQGARPLVGAMLGLLLYAFGRTQEFIRIEMLSLWWLSLCTVWWGLGWRALRLTWFAWVFALFVLPLPFSLVLTLTAPLKEAVSALATGWLDALGYPIGRSGVVITVGQYQLLVAEACAGLHSMFILEAMGLLYSHLAQHTAWRRNVALAVMAVPVSFMANVVRVMILVAVTYHLGDRVGQGFVHHFAGLLLFAVALVLMALVDLSLSRIWPDAPASRPNASPQGAA